MIKFEISKSVINIQNKVITARLELPPNEKIGLNLREIAAKHCLDKNKPKYDPGKFHPIIFKYENPSGPVLVFHNGVVVCAGNVSIITAKLLIAKTILSIVKNNPSLKGLRIIYNSYKSENVVASIKLPFKLNSRSVKMKRKGRIRSSKTDRINRFSKLHIDGIPLNIAIIAFESGKVVMTGPKTESQVLDGFRIALPHLYNIRRSGWDL